MPIFIDEINIKNIGPISEKFGGKLVKLNLFYGGNETGKTLLTEFIMCSLFKTRGLDIRPIVGSGKIIVAGLDKNPVSFSPSSSKKFEDYQLQNTVGITTHLPQLFIVKGAKVELGTDETDKIILQRYLSGKEILDIIENRVKQVNTREANIENNEIIGKNLGDIKTRNEKRTTLKTIDTLFTDINQQYLGGDRRILENQKIETEKQLMEMENAKRFYANTISKNIEQLENTRHEIEDDVLDEISKEINVHDTKEKDHGKKGEQYNKTSQNSKNYSWVKKAEEIYNGQLRKTSSISAKKFLLIPLIIIMILAGAFSFLNLFFGVIGCLAALIVFGWFYVKGYQELLQESGKNSEIERLKEGYQSRFGQPLTDLALLKIQVEQLQQEYSQSEVLNKQLSEEETQLRESEDQISLKMNNLFGKTIEKNAWNETIKQAKEKNKKLDKEIKEEQIKLSGLNVDETDYNTEPPSLEYDKKTYEKLQSNLTEINGEIQKIDTNLNGLKNGICSITGDDPNLNWETLIQHLKQKRKEIDEEYNELTAQLVGQISVIKVLRELRKVEDKKIQEALQSDLIKKPLYDVTKRYTDFRLEGDNLFVVDPYTEFPLNQLSTGAKDQVLLALRIGFCSKLFKQDSMFLIFDDAFQHSDYKRRPLLVEKTIELVKNGWQVIYLTMDDHLKALFDEKGKALGTDYKTFTLPSTQ